MERGGGLRQARVLQLNQIKTKTYTNTIHRQVRQADMRPATNRNNMGGSKEGKIRDSEVTGASQSCQQG